jgi:hypothetical protein
MSPGLLDNPNYWRNRAEEARVVAESIQEQQSKEVMLGVARDFERMAALAEERLKRGKKII